MSTDWTLAWTRASALALSAPLRRPLPPHPAAWGLLRQCLQDVVARHDLPLLGWLILPDGLHVVGAQPSCVPWPDAVGRVKQAFSHRSRQHPWAPPGAWWRCSVRVRPLAERDLPGALAGLHEMPVRAGLCAGPDDWSWSSSRQAARTTVA